MLHLSKHTQLSSSPRIVIVGNVDDGKSTLIGRLLFETGSLSEAKIEELKTMSEQRSMPFEWSFVLDAFQIERNQGITIDTTQVGLKTQSCRMILIDIPGHVDFLKSMLTGAADADGALLVIDAVEGLRQQTKRHSYLLSLLGIRQIGIIVNKMDLVNFSEIYFHRIVKEISYFLNELDMNIIFGIPISARNGDMIARHSEEMKWYKGETLLESFDIFQKKRQTNYDPLRLPIQDVYKFDKRRILVGRIESGKLQVGDTLLFSPSGKTARLSSIETWNTEPPSVAQAGQSIGITLDEQIFVERGEIASQIEASPHLTKILRIILFWIGDLPLKLNNSYKIRLTTRETWVVVKSINYKIDLDTLEKKSIKTLNRYDCGEVVLSSQEYLAIDAQTNLNATGRCVLLENDNIVGAGVISKVDVANRNNLNVNLHEVLHRISRNHRKERNGHSGGVFWLTGLSGAGKSTIAMEVERRLFNKGYQVYVLDGDNVRGGLSADLGFSEEDRKENVRRVSEVAALFENAGFICIVALISPFNVDRQRARKLIRSFHEIYVKATLATCEQRDPKGLYKKARTGLIPEFTGIFMTYEAPQTPELIIDTEYSDVGSCVEKVLNYVEDHLAIKTQENNC